MAATIPFPRKRRTRGHVIADIAVNHVERFIYAAGFTAERTRHDYGDDLLIATYDKSGFVEQGHVSVQIRSTETVRATADGAYCLLRVETAHFLGWFENPLPVLLVLFEAKSRSAFWAYLQRDLQSTSAGRQSVTIRIPPAQRLNRKTIESARRWKNNILTQMIGSVDHV